MSALLIKDLSYSGFSSRDLLRSSRALKVSFLFMKVKARLEQMIAFSFLLEGSRFIASVYFCSASSYFPPLISQFPSSFSCSHFLAVFKANLHFFWPGSSLIPSVKYFLALELSPPYSSIIPFKYQKSGDFWSSPTEMVFRSVSASVVSPIFASASTLNSFNFQFCEILSTRQIIQESASVQSAFSTAC